MLLYTLLPHGLFPSKEEDYCTPKVSFKIGSRGASHQRSSFGGGSGGTSREIDFVLGRASQFTGTHLGRWEICVGN